MGDLTHQSVVLSADRGRAQGGNEVAAELAGQGIRVTAVCPGFTLTEFAQANGTQSQMDAAPRRFFQTAEQVVQIAIAANARGKVVVIPGLHNRIAAAFMHYLPTGLVRAVAMRASAKYHLGD